MPYHERVRDLAMTAIHDLRFENLPYGDQAERLHQLMDLPFEMVVEIALRDGYDLQRLIRYVGRLPKAERRVNNVIPFERRA